MNYGPIISDAEAQQIRKNDLRKLALEKRAAEQNNAKPERKAEIMAQIEKDVQEQLRQESRRIDPGSLVH